MCDFSQQRRQQRFSLNVTVVSNASVWMWQLSATPSVWRQLRFAKYLPMWEGFSIPLGEGWPLLSSGFSWRGW